MADRIEVGACRCPDTPHEQDWVEISPHLTLDGGLFVVSAAGDPSIPSERRGPTALRGLMRTEIVRWSFVNDKGESVPINDGSIGYLLPYKNGGATVAGALAPRLEEAIEGDPFSKAQTRSSSGSGQTRRTKPKTSPTSTSPTTSSSSPPH